MTAALLTNAQFLQQTVVSKSETCQRRHIASLLFDKINSGKSILQQQLTQLPESNKEEKDKTMNMISRCDKAISFLQNQLSSFDALLISLADQEEKEEEEFVLI